MLHHDLKKRRKMVKIDELAEKIFSLLKGNGLKIKIFDTNGAETTDPSLGRRFFVMSPNIMVTINEEENSVEFSKGASVKDDVLPLQKNIRKLADKFMMNSDIKIFGKSIKPKHFAYQAKMQKDSVMENSPIQPVNSLLLGKVLHKIGYFGKATAAQLADDLVVDLNDVQRVINRLVKDGKVTTAGIQNGYYLYTKKMEEAIAEDTYTSEKDPEKAKAQLKHVMKRNAVTGQDNRDLTGYTMGNKRGQKDVPRVNRFAFPSKSTSVQKKNMTPFGNLAESFSKMFGSARTSHQVLENVRILVKHRAPVDESVRGARARQISAIFLECNGERFRFPHNYLAGARAMAQHMAHGGTFSDKVGSHIMESTGNLLKLQSFNRYVTSNKLINEDSSGIVETVKENIQTIRTELRKLTGSKTYETVKARLETYEREQLAEDDVSQLKDLFTIRRFDEKFEEVLPIVKQLVQEKDTFLKRIEESASGLVRLRREAISSIPMFEFASENARLGYKISELALRIVENEELAGFLGKIGTKICKEGQVNDFEKAVLSQVLENAKVDDEEKEVKEIKECIEIENFFNKYDMKFF